MTIWNDQPIPKTTPHTVDTEKGVVIIHRPQPRAINNGYNTYAYNKSIILPREAVAPILREHGTVEAIFSDGKKATLRGIDMYRDRLNRKYGLPRFELELMDTQCFHPW